MCICYNKLLYDGSTKYLKFPFRILCIRDAHNFVICKLRKTLQVIRTSHKAFCYRKALSSILG